MINLKTFQFLKMDARAIPFDCVLFNFYD
eukprot:UN06236